MENIEKYKPTFTDITNWNKKPYSSTGGTRSKKIYTNLNEEEYFFKGSKKLNDDTFKYPTEFWSEIVSSKIGQWLGFDLLDYNIAYDKNDEQQIGCLSKSMVEYTENKLSEGIDFLRGYDSSYNPNEDEYRYTFDFIKKTLNYFKLTNYEPKFIKMLIFDAIIGNSDRHQENWGFISKYKETIIEIDEEIKTKKSFFSKIEPKMRKFIAKIALINRGIEEENNIKTKRSTLLNESLVVRTEFSPIYDSGCCLGRELLDVKIEKMVTNSQMMEAFINKGRSEVRFNEGKKPRHFDLLKALNNDYEKIFVDTLKIINHNYSLEKLSIIINNIDKELPIQLFNFKLPDNRKDLMIKLINLRINKLNNLSE
ncbi:hypothetical protein [Tenacibaculum finnmarkense]|uniref:hypothetical protein n=1 Tax=Tenacibaculum finnmarkense TaxID=2781243 RepID=UPI00187BB979|nr:hypothetical protein [Tenacibaculum finnmarkense]MBE7693284.1 hypothetical protein [Tenacibaculum finnmarkense genomovar finnmarkense]